MHMVIKMTSRVIVIFHLLIDTPSLNSGKRWSLWMVWTMFIGFEGGAGVRHWVVESFYRYYA